jgi:hypothetical protein
MVWPRIGDLAMICDSLERVFIGATDEDLEDVVMEDDFLRIPMVLVECFLMKMRDDSGAVLESIGNRRRISFDYGVFVDVYLCSTHEYFCGCELGFVNLRATQLPMFYFNVPSFRAFQALVKLLVASVNSQVWETAFEGWVGAFSGGVAPSGVFTLGGIRWQANDVFLIEIFLTSFCGHVPVSYVNFPAQSVDFSIQFTTNIELIVTVTNIRVPGTCKCICVMYDASDESPVQCVIIRDFSVFAGMMSVMQAVIRADVNASLDTLMARTGLTWTDPLRKSDE